MRDESGTPDPVNLELTLKVRVPQSAAEKLEG